MIPKGNLLTPDQLIHKYQQLELLGWNASKIGVFYNNHLLHGKWNRQDHKAYIIENSMLDLINYLDQVSIKRMQLLALKDEQHIYYTPLELVEEYPQIADYNWSAIVIGMFFNSGLLIGHRTGKKQRALIVQSSFLDLLGYADKSEQKYR
jgi:hypothetical protein